MAARFICIKCKNPPRPGGTIRTGYCQNKCHTYDVVHPLCGNCHHCPDGWAVEKDEFLSKVVNAFHKFDCINFKNGCREELEANGLEAHEEICQFRDVTCPKLGCNSKFAFNEILDHFKIMHEAKVKDDVLEFKGSLEDLKKSTFILNCNGKPFFPQFKIDDDNLHIWVIGDEDKMVCTIHFFVIEAIEIKFKANVKAIQKSQDVMKVSLKKIDIDLSRFNQFESIWFQMKITSKKFE